MNATSMVPEEHQNTWRTAIYPAEHEKAQCFDWDDCRTPYGNRAGFEWEKG
jgi:hypothetical protein